ncbi:GTP-binding protein Era [Oceanococcus atlanticus]|uniref:GTPase Era n=1 Tax=Oceanococcus atlanticus TaxID=1317117 RepID=A0A1Y1SDC3_9GAMM|nr:GTP-binding protein Era [Oceanococcus atlanticus]
MALVGRPNVGKSTLMNALLGERLSIVSPKAQTTRHRVMGVLTRADSQYVFVDTPGQADIQGKALNRLLDRTAISAMADVDVTLWVVEPRRWTSADDQMLARMQRARPGNLGLILSKVDQIKDKSALLPEIGRLHALIQPDFLVPLSATKGDNLEALFSELDQRLPEGPWLYDADTLTPHSAEFLVAEHIRQQLFLRLNKELPYATTVTIDRMSQSDHGNEVHATIWVNRPSHKGIVIGKQGQGLKAIGQSARERLQGLFDQSFDIHLWVKVREGWADHEDSLRAFGYGATE